RPPSAAYKLRKFARRNRAAVLTAATVAAALLVGTAVAIWQAVVATRAERAALAALAETEQARAAEKAAKGTAEAREAETKAVLACVQNKLLAAARPKNQDGGMGYDVKLADAVKAALPFVDKSFPTQPLIEARLRMALGASFGYLGEVKIAAGQFEAARRLYTE